jgi:hypothetical protein
MVRDWFRRREDCDHEGSLNLAQTHHTSISPDLGYGKSEQHQGLQSKKAAVLHIGKTALASPRISIGCKIIQMPAAYEIVATPAQGAKTLKASRSRGA